MDQEQLTAARLTELAGRCAERGYYVFSDFLSLSEQNLFWRLQPTWKAPASLEGGADGCERKLAVFGNADYLGYEEAPPIACLRISPKDRHFAQTLSHRDYLGALMQLGIKRETVGDILVGEQETFLFCSESMAPFIQENFHRAAHTELTVSRCETPPETVLFKTEERMIQCSSPRLDAVVAHTFRLSREKAQELIASELVFVNGRTVTASDRECREGERISVRGCGKMIYLGFRSFTKKQKQNIAVALYL